MKLVLVGLLLFTVILAGCASSPPTTNTNDPPAPIGDVKTFAITAKMFEFVPGTIEVNQGDTVILNITSTDTTHGISIPEFGVNTTIPPGQTVKVQFVADKAGTFSFSCSVFCGVDHGNMKGTLIVK